MVCLKTKEDIELLKKSGAILVRALKALEKEVRPGVSLLDLDKLAASIIRDAGATPEFLGYKPTPRSKPYPATICASVNDVIVHGIPYDTLLQDGDIISLDIGVRYQNRVTDAAMTLGVGNSFQEAENLLKTAKKALNEGLKACKPGKTLGDIGFAIESVAEHAGAYIVEKLTGHGVGFELHELPTVYNFGEKGTGLLLEPGMVLSIEPMIATGTGEVSEGEDGSFKTKDGSLAAHVEKTIAITERGFLDLTPW